MQRAIRMALLTAFRNLDLYYYRPKHFWFSSSQSTPSPDCTLYMVYNFYVPETHIMYFIQRCLFFKCSEEIHYVPIGDGDMRSGQFKGSKKSWPPKNVLRNGS